MKCPECNGDRDKVIDSRDSGERKSKRRRRVCLGCGHRFTTYEHYAPVFAEGREVNHLASKTFIELVLPVLEFVEFHNPGALEEARKRHSLIRSIIDGSAAVDGMASHPAPAFPQ